MHSVLPPSGAAAWVHCPMWVRMNIQYPQDDSPESIEGTAAHWTLGNNAAIAPSGFVVTDEMRDGSELFWETVIKYCNSYPNVHMEETVNIPLVHKDCFGTPDLWDWDGEWLTVIDYKFGHGFVDEIANCQLIAYTSGVASKLGLTEPANVKIRHIIVQPRCYHKGSPVRVWETTLSDLGPHITRLRTAANLAFGINPQAATNPECCHCPGRHACAALQKAAYSDAEFASDILPVDIEPSAAALELKMLERAYDRLGARIDGLREQLLANLRAGGCVPYYRLEQMYGRQNWSVPVDQVVALGELYGADLSKPGVVTPKQAEQKGIDGAVISAYSRRTSSGFKLVADDPHDAMRIFK